MTGRRGNTGARPTPIEETEPTAPEPQPVPEPAPEPEPDTEELRRRFDAGGPDALTLVERERLSAAEAGDDLGADDEEPPVTYARIAAMLEDALSDIRRGPFGIVAAQHDDYPLTVHEAIADVTRRIGAIEKTGRSTEGYRFRGIDQALAALHPILGDVGLVIVPGRVIREQWETRATAKGGTLNVARLLVSYTFVGPDGTKLRAAAWGEGADSGDKATQKAHSQSYKTLVFQAFTIPTESSADDEPDAVNPESRPFTTEERTRAQSAWRAAREANGFEQLGGVRHRALGLLDVPIDGGDPDGTLAPLSWWFDQRRAELERVQS